MPSPGVPPPHDIDSRTSGQWPSAIREFWDSGEAERFYLSGNDGDHLNYLARRGSEVLMWSRSLGGVAMERLSRQYRQARAVVEAGRGRDLRRGFILTFLILALSTWLVSLALLVFFASRISRPIHDLTAGLSALAAGDFSARVPADRDDEVGRAIRAFNHMADELERQRARLVYLTQLASWQTLARKMAHELKNSLTPIRLTMEEMLARSGDGDRAFMEQAAADRGRRGGQPGAPRARLLAIRRRTAGAPEALDVNALVEERMAFLRSGHPEVAYELRLAPELPPAFADPDLSEGHPDEPAGERRRSRRRRRPGPGRHCAGRRRDRHRGPRLRPGAERTGAPVALRADHLLQEARHGAGALHRAEERPAAGR